MALGYWASYLCWSAYTGCPVLKNVITRTDIFSHTFNQYRDNHFHGFSLSNLDFVQLIF